MTQPNETLPFDDLQPPRDWTRGYIRAAAAAAIAHLILLALLLLGRFDPDQLVGIGTLIYGVGVLAGAAFLVVYTVLARWWKTPIGVLFELIGFAIVTSGIVVLASLVLGLDYPGREQVRIVGYLLFTDSSVGILITYLIERRHPRPVIPTRPRRRGKDAS